MDFPKALTLLALLGGFSKRGYHPEVFMTRLCYVRAPKRFCLTGWENKRLRKVCDEMGVNYSSCLAVYQAREVLLLGEGEEGLAVSKKSGAPKLA